MTRTIHAPGFGSAEMPAPAMGQGIAIPRPRKNGSASAIVVPFEYRSLENSTTWMTTGATHAPASKAATDPIPNASSTEPRLEPRRSKRVENRVELTRILGEVFKKRSKREWLELLEAAGVPNGPINDIAQVFEEPQVKARGVRIELEHAAAGRLPLVGSPMRFSATPIEYRLAPPLLGEHTDEVLRGVLGKSDAELARLRAARVI